MKALIVGAVPCDTGCVTLLQTLAEEAGLVLAADGGGEHCLRAGVTPYAIVGDMDSISESTELALKGEGAIALRFPAEKDETDLDLAIGVAREQGADEIVLTAVLGGRFDQTLATLGTTGRYADLRPVIREVDVTVWLADATHTPELPLDGAVGRFSVVALGGPATVSVTGARWPLDRAELAPLSSLGVSNVAAEAQVTVTVHQGLAAVIVDEHA